MDMKEGLSIPLLLILLLSPVFADQIQQTSDGGYIIASGQYLVRTDDSGNLQWNKSFGGNIESVQQTSDKGYVASGSIYISSKGEGSRLPAIGNVFWVLKTDPNGNLQWNKTFYRHWSGSFEEIYETGSANSILQTSDGGYIVVGNTGYWKEPWTIKMDSDGNVQWVDVNLTGSYVDVRQIVSRVYNRIYSIRQTPDGGYILAGDIESSESKYVYPNVLLRKMDSKGNKQWERVFSVYTHGYSSGANSVQITTDGGYILAGYGTIFLRYKSVDWGETDTDFWLIKTDAAGNEQWNSFFSAENIDWNKTFDADIEKIKTSDVAQSVQQTSDGGFVVVGTTSKNNGDILLIKTDSKGNEQWIKIFGGKDADSADSIQKTSDAGYIIKGNTNSSVWLIKIDAAGNEQWNKVLGRPDKKQVQVTQTPPKVPVEPQSAGGASLDNNASNQAVGIIQEATKKGDASVCNKIEVFSVRDGCIMSVAIARGDIKLCDTMSAETKQMTGQDKICKAAVSRDTKYCDEITTYMGVGQEEVRNTCRMWGKNANATAPAGTPTGPLTQLKNKVVSIFFGGAAATHADDYGPMDGGKTKPECTSEKDCGDGICDDGKCAEPKLTLLFVPVNWKGSMSDFDKKVDERADFLLNALPLKNCKESAKIIKSHENCRILKLRKALNSDILQVKTCALRTATSYDYVIGLGAGLYDDVNGISLESFGTAIVDAGDFSAAAHEMGHLLGLRDEYCNYKRVWGSILCGFDASPNPLKSEYGCRKEDSPYDDDKFPDCCTSDEYADSCTGNVGLSESEIATKIYEQGTYDVIEKIQGDVSYVYKNVNECGTSSLTKEKINNSLIALKLNVDKLKNLQKTIGFSFGKRYDISQKLGKITESTTCSEKDNVCGCLMNYGDDFKEFDKISSSNKYIINFIELTSNIMSSTQGTEFSKPAYNYLSTLPKMKCSNTPTTTPTAMLAKTPDITATATPSPTPTASQKVWWSVNDSVCWDVDKSKGNFMLDFDDKHITAALSWAPVFDDKRGTMVNVGIKSTSPFLAFRFYMDKAAFKYYYVMGGQKVDFAERITSMHYEAFIGENVFFYMPKTSSGEGWVVCAKRSDGHNTLPLGKYYVSTDAGATWESFDGM